jgi:hypothetical protein
MSSKVMNKQHIFVFSNTPDGSSVLQGVFPIEKEKEAVEFNNKAHGYRNMMIGEWSGFGEIPPRGALQTYKPKKSFYPFKVIGSKRNGFHVLLPGKNSPVGDYYIYEGDFEDCQKECDRLNEMLQSILENYLEENQ